MNNPRGVHQPQSELAGHVERRLRAELTVLRAQLDQLRGEGAEDHRAADSGDRAEALRRADDVFRIEDRINEINRLLAIGPAPTRAAPRASGVLVEGTTVTLRFPDGQEETFYATSVLDLDTAPGDTPVEPLGLDSPLAKALAGHTAGNTISWRTPTGLQQAHIVTIQPPTSPGH
jgi:transcription elongation factor GreA